MGMSNARAKGFTMNELAKMEADLRQGLEICLKLQGKLPGAVSTVPGPRKGLKLVASDVIVKRRTTIRKNRP